MLLLAFCLLSAAVLFGTVLAALHLLAPRSLRWPMGVGHGVLGAAGLGVLVLALRGPPRGTANGVASFGPVGAVLGAAALLLGLIIAALTWRKARGTGFAIAAHATLAISAYVMLFAFLSLG